jgi:uncharacterized protein (DUF486 family)
VSPSGECSAIRWHVAELPVTIAAMSQPIVLTTLLLVASNVFMTFAWYGHLKNFAQSPWYVAALFSWGIALFEYLLQVPANRIGYGTLDLGQLKILQEVITLSVFVPFALFYMHQPFKLDYLYAALCLMGAVYFIFRN